MLLNHRLSIVWTHDLEEIDVNLQKEQPRQYCGKKLFTFKFVKISWNYRLSMSSNITLARASQWVCTRYSPTHVTRWSLKVRWDAVINALLVLNLHLDVIDGIRWFDFERDEGETLLIRREMPSWSLIFMISILSVAFSVMVLLVMSLDGNLCVSMKIISWRTTNKKLSTWQESIYMY